MKENRRLLVFFIALLVVASTLVIVKPVFAQTTPNPSVPQFSVEVNKGTIVVTIKNQPLPTALDDEDAALYYNIQVKDHDETDWIDLYTHSEIDAVYKFTIYDCPIQSTSEYTTLALPANYPVNSEIDIQVQAIIAKMGEIAIPNFLPDNGLRYHGHDDYTYKPALRPMSSSEWSPVQTLVITSGFSSPLPVPTKLVSPTIPPTATPSTNENQPLANNKDVSVPLMTFLLVVMVLTTIIIGLLLMLLKSRTQAFG
ncbi:MAG: hypothetical protein NWE92_01935 [Candidatus Bathyarchaeota archaeon]|nr:hypothetical protein [Candidatus Bathyarchaeota archaeon]